MIAVEAQTNISLERETSQRKALSSKYGMWYSDNSTPAEIISWCDSRIQRYKEWIKNCETLKRQNQERLFDGMSLEDLKRIINEREARQA